MATDPHVGRRDTAQQFDDLLRAERFSDAETLLKNAIKAEPDRIVTRRLLAQLLCAQGRRYESSFHIRHLFRLRAVEHAELLSLIDLSGPFNLVHYDTLTGTGPETLFGIGAARMEYFSSRRDVDSVLSLLSKVRRNHPEHPTAVALTGRVLAENARWDELREWISEIPNEVWSTNQDTNGNPGLDRPLTLQDEPEFWLTIGIYLAQAGQDKDAVDAWAESLRRDPTNRAALRQIVSTVELNLPESSPWHQHSQELRQWMSDLDKVFRSSLNANAEQSAWIADRMQAWFRPWESAAWTVRTAQLTGQLSNVVPELDRRRVALLAWESKATELQVQQARLQRTIGFVPEPFHPPSWDQTSVAGGSLKNTPRTPIVFQDVATELGINSSFTTGYPADGNDFYLHQTNGVGLAALDYDLDGRCDTYFARAGGTANQTNSLPNQMFRQLPNGKFDEVTVVCQADDRGYGQGVCVGDLNQDGFPDLLIANIGRNQAYLNQGDGTFQLDANRIVGNQNRWTSSLGLADLNADALPELVEINYIDDPQALEVKCLPPFAICQPQSFRSAQDHVFAMNADGSLEPWEIVCEAMSENPKLGFGVVIGNFDNQCGNDFFVSNDGDLNHFWVSQCDRPRSSNSDLLIDERRLKDGSNPIRSIETMSETASFAGCAVGRTGIGEACMGVAAGDFNRDGKMDLHVTNFHEEAVNLFVQTASGFFSDEALSFGLSEASKPTTGFGTQAADFDCDGWLDLVVLNGHLFNQVSTGVPYKMLPQLFSGGDRGFALQEPQIGGDYFQLQQLGRTVATVDFNRDGRIDLLCNHLDKPVALLLNKTDCMHSIQIELIGKESERDATGAVVRVRSASDVDGNPLTAFALAGGGYMCTNERLLHVGVGGSDGTVDLEIVWPSGQRDSLANMPVDHRYQILEGGEVIGATPYGE